MTTPSGESRRAARVFPARRAALPGILTFLDEASAGLERRVGLMLALVVEELFTNTVAHGHGGDSDQPVTVAVETEAGSVRLTYEDTAPPHDPFAGARPAGGGGSRPEPPVGGLGVLLVQRLACDLAYAHTDGRNRISLRIVATP